MKKLWINKEKILSIILAGTLTLCGTGCGKSTNEKEELPEETPLIIVDSGMYIGKNNVMVDLSVLNNNQYVKMADDNQYAVYSGANIYFKVGEVIVDEVINDQPIKVTAIETNGVYTLIIMPDGREAYVDNNLLIKCVKLTNSEYVPVLDNNDRILLSNAYLYDANGIYMGYLREGQPCQIIATNGQYALISLDNGVRGYVIDETVMKDYKRIDGFGFIAKGTSVYSNKTLNNLAYNDSDAQIVTVLYINDTYAAIIDNISQDVVYVRIKDVDSDFIDINLTNQKMDCYLNYHLAGSWYTRTGKNSTPTHEGAFDIDDKCNNFAFTSYPGSYAHYWIPFNENTEEGIHDLIGDDEENYGNQAYQLNGSHGCVRVPAAASKFVYDNYEVGDMVLVRKK